MTDNLFRISPCTAAAGSIGPTAANFQVQQFESHGFGVITGVIDDAACDALTERLEALDSDAAGTATQHDPRRPEQPIEGAPIVVDGHAGSGIARIASASD